MPSFGEIVQKAFYLGVGLASYATEKAEVTFQEFKIQAQKLADEMVDRGEMTTEEARKFVDDLIQQAQKQQVEQSEDSDKKEPRLIEILTEDEESAQKKSETPDSVNNLRQQVQSLQDELRRLKQE
ncbi:MAG: phasin family protein [Prochloraceae cyanobacterium]